MSTSLATAMDSDGGSSTGAICEDSESFDALNLHTFDLYHWGILIGLFLIWTIITICIGWCLHYCWTKGNYDPDESMIDEKPPIETDPYKMDISWIKGPPRTSMPAEWAADSTDEIPSVIPPLVMKCLDTTRSSAYSTMTQDADQVIDIVDSGKGTMTNRAVFRTDRRSSQSLNKRSSFHKRPSMLAKMDLARVAEAARCTDEDGSATTLQIMTPNNLRCPSALNVSYTQGTMTTPGTLRIPEITEIDRPLSMTQRVHGSIIVGAANGCMRQRSGGERDELSPLPPPDMPIRGQSSLTMGTEMDPSEHRESQLTVDLDSPIHPDGRMPRHEIRSEDGGNRTVSVSFTVFDTPQCL